MTGLARDWEPLSQLFSERAFRRVVSGSRGRSLPARRRGCRARDRGSFLAALLEAFLETLFEHHPYGKLTTGSLESLAAIRREKLLAYHRAWLRPERLVLSVSGKLSRAELDAWLKDFDAHAQKFANAHACAAISRRRSATSRRSRPRAGWSGRSDASSCISWSEAWVRRSTRTIVTRSGCCRRCWAGRAAGCSSSCARRRAWRTPSRR